MDFGLKFANDGPWRAFSLERAIRSFVAAAGLVLAVAGLASAIEDWIHWGLWLRHTVSFIGEHTESLALIFGFVAGIASNVFVARPAHEQKGKKQ